MSEFSEADLRALRKYRDTKTPIPIESDKHMFMRLFHKKLVIGGVGHNEKGDPVGVIRLTRLGKEALERMEAVP